MTTALLVIDVQQGLCEGEHGAFESQQVIERINQVSAKTRAAGGVVVFIQHESNSGYLEFETDAWRLARGLHVEATEIRMHLSAPQVIRHHNETLATISSFGPRVRVVSTEALRIET
jgi:nicotinamidase-related amidase